MIDQTQRKKLVLKAAARAEKVRVQCNLTHQQAVDPIDIAKIRGCDVRFMSLPSLEGIYSPQPSATIIVGAERPAGRRAYTCAHELGHHEFGHGMRVEEIKSTSNKTKTEQSEEEFLADVFAGMLLMPQMGVIREIKNRNFDTSQISPINIYRIASFFGVGYSTVIEHMTWNLGIFNRRQHDILLKTRLKEIKILFGAKPEFELVLVDERWENRAVNLEVGDFLVLPVNSLVDDDFRLEYQHTYEGQPIYRAAKRGYSRAYSKCGDWAVNIRIARRWYEGLAEYRFFDEQQEDDCDDMLSQDTTDTRK